MTTPDLEQVLAELESLNKQAEREAAGYGSHPTGAQRTFRYKFIDSWPFLLAKLRAAVEMEKALNCVGCGIPRYNCGRHTSLVDALAAWRQAGEEK